MNYKFRHDQEMVGSATSVDGGGNITPIHVDEPACPIDEAVTSNFDVTVYLNN